MSGEVFFLVPFNDWSPGTIPYVKGMPTPVVAVENLDRQTRMVIELVGEKIVAGKSDRYKLCAVRYWDPGTLVSGTHPDLLFFILFDLKEDKGVCVPLADEEFRTIHMGNVKTFIDRLK